jgi:hypothetical protein
MRIARGINYQSQGIRITTLPISNYTSANFNFRVEVAVAQHAGLVAVAQEVDMQIEALRIFKGGICILGAGLGLIALSLIFPVPGIITAGAITSGIGSMISAGGVEQYRRGK